MKQYANSPIIQNLVDKIRQWYDAGLISDEFYNQIWNIDTAGTYGLDVWGRIVVIGRYLEIVDEIKAFGFENATEDWEPFDVEPFAPEEQTTSTFRLENDVYRKLILTKAMKNISSNSIPDINQILNLLFGEDKSAFVLDLGNMKMRYVFEFYLEAFERAIFQNENLVPRPCGVGVEMFEFPNNEFFGFYEMGDAAMPFDDGVFCDFEIGA